MVDSEQIRSFVIVGQTPDGQRFRPSDWAERLCGVMSSFGPAPAQGGHLTYSPYVMPGTRNGVKTVTVDARLYALEPRAWRFVLGFARDNNLVVEPVGGPAYQPGAQAAVSAAHH